MPMRNADKELYGDVAMSFQEIADALGMKRQNVIRTYHKAMGKLSLKVIARYRKRDLLN